MTPTIRYWRSTSLGAEELEPSCSSAIRRVRAQAASPRDELEKGEQPRRHDGRPLAHCAAGRARVVGQDRRSQRADRAGASRPAGSLRAPRRPRRPAATGRAGTPGRARPQGLLRASRCGRPRRGGKRPAPVTKPGGRADQTRTSRSSQAALIDSDERSVGPHHDRLRSADRTRSERPGPPPQNPRAARSGLVRQRA